MTRWCKAVRASRWTAPRVAESLRTLQNQQLENAASKWVAAAPTSNLYSGGGSLVLLVLICLSAVTAREYRPRPSSPGFRRA